MPTRAQSRDLGISSADLDRLFADLDRYLAQHAPPKASAGLVTASLDQLIQQAGILTGPAARERRGLLRRRPRGPQVTVAQHLDMVAAVIERYGWVQHTLQRGAAMCTRGAQILLVQIGHSSADIANRAVAYLDAATPHGVTYIQWQDNPQRTRQQVLDRIRWAAGEARKAGA